jgi:hypothetical protein
MNRREFIKTSAVLSLAPNLNSKELENAAIGHKGDTGNVGWKGWHYVVYCYERGQGEWTFSQNIRGSFAYQREYMTLEEDDTSSYCGWMDQGKLHFATLDDATDFVDCHVRAKEDVNIVDSIYDIYYIQRRVDFNQDTDGHETETKVAHYWFNGDTGRQIHWVAEKPYTNWSRVECG